MVKFWKNLHKGWKALIALLIVAGLPVAVIAAAGDTLFKGRLLVQDGYDAPTIATATGAGDLFVEDAIEANGALDVAGASTLTGAVTTAGALAANGGITVDSTAFIVADTSGNTTIAGTLETTGVTTHTALVTATSGFSATNSLYAFANEDVGSTCITGQIKLDTATTKELCICQTTDTWWCIDVTTSSGNPKD